MAESTRTARSTARVPTRGGLRKRAGPAGPGAGRAEASERWPCLPAQARGAGGANRAREAIGANRAVEALMRGASPQARAPETLVPSARLVYVGRLRRSLREPSACLRYSCKSSSSSELMGPETFLGRPSGCFRFLTAKTAMKLKAHFPQVTSAVQWPSLWAKRLTWQFAPSCCQQETQR